MPIEIEFEDDGSGTGNTGQPIPRSIFDAVGDLIVGTGDNTYDNLPVGANGTVIVADSTQSMGMRWAVPDVTQVELDAAVAAITASIAAVPRVQTGTVHEYWGDVAPAGYLLCFGQLVSQASQPALFTAIGHNGNAGVDPGGGNFRIPDRRGNFGLGRDNMGGSAAGRVNYANILGTAGGVESVALGVLNLPAHTHTVADPGHGHAGSTVTVASDGAHTHPVTGTASPAAGAFILTGGTLVYDSADGGARTGATNVNANVTGTATSAGAHTHPGSSVAIANATTGIVVGGGGSGVATGLEHANMPPFTTANFIIKL